MSLSDSLACRSQIHWVKTWWYWPTSVDHHPPTVDRYLPSAKQQQRHATLCCPHQQKEKKGLIPTQRPYPPLCNAPAGGTCTALVDCFSGKQPIHQWLPGVHSLISRSAHAPRPVLRPDSASHTSRRSPPTAAPQHSSLNLQAAMPYGRSIALWQRVGHAREVCPAHMRIDELLRGGSGKTLNGHEEGGGGAVREPLCLVT